MNNKMQQEHEKIKRPDNKMLFIVVILLITVVATGIFAIVQYREKNNLSSAVNESYSKSLTNLVTSLNDMNVTMNKTFLCADTASMSENLMKVNKLSELSLDALNTLPISQVEKQQVTQYLNTVADYAFSLNRILLNGDAFTDLEISQYETLTDLSKGLYDAVYAFQVEMQQEENQNLFAENADTKELFFSASSSESVISKTFKSIDDQLIAMPTMIYDGPYSSTVENITPEILKEQKVTKETAMENLRKIFKLDDQGENIAFVSATNGKIPTYIFTIEKNADEVYTAEISQNGGRLIQVSGIEGTKDAALSMQQAQEKAEAFLKYLGIDDMQVKYYEKYENTAVFNFAYVQNGVTVYADLIKVQISLKTGNLVGYEATGYYSSHKTRTLGTTKYTQTQAQEKLNVDLDITNVSKALIPKSSKKEVLCYEFKGTYRGNMYIIYINANTLRQEEIFQVLRADDSVLVL